MTEDKLLKELYKVQNQIVGWLFAGAVIGFLLGWIAGILVANVK
jgi:hypothetical protein